MKAKNGLFYTLIAVMTAALSFFYREFETSLNEEGYEARRRAALEAQLQREKLQTEVVHHQLLTFQASVASVLPSLKDLKLSQKQSVELAQLAVTVRGPASTQVLESEQFLFESAREDFRHKNYGEVVGKLKRYLALGTGIKTIDAHALLAESYFQLSEYEHALKTMQTMAEVYPDHPLTGLVLFRMGRILEKRKREGEAQALYKILQKSFPDHKLIQSQARALILKEVQQ